MHIRDLADQAGVTVKAVRYYESQDLLRPAREPNGYRTYEEQDVAVVREISALLSLGLTTQQAYPFVECLRADNDRADVCAGSLQAYRSRIVEVDVRIAELTDLRDRLVDLLTDAESRRRPTIAIHEVETS